MPLRKDRGWHHWRDGWHFGRGFDGSVFVEKRRDVPAAEGTEVVEFTAVIPASEWASIVAAVSAKGEDAITFGMAKELHGEG